MRFLLAEKKVESTRTEICRKERQKNVEKKDRKKRRKKKNPLKKEVHQDVFSSVKYYGQMIRITFDVDPR